jgi:L-threonylcarbamoyladenylate synthase
LLAVVYKIDKFDDEIVALLRREKVGLLPTDTIYGLSCAASSRMAVERIHRIKRRDKSKPFVILISGTEQLEELGIAAAEAAPALRYWPGKLTIICKAPKAPEWLHMGTGTLAVRQPDYPELIELIRQTGSLVSTSANLAGGEPAVTAAVAEEYFGDRLDFYVDAGPLKGQPSTIARKNFKNGLEVIRQGSVHIINT